MQTTHKKSETVRAYLLGLLDDREASELEARYFMDPAYLRLMQGVEEALIEDYCGGRLSRADRERFEIRYLEVPELRRKLEEVRARLDRAARQARPRVGRMLSVAFACFVFFAVIGVTWRYRHAQSGQTTMAAKAPMPAPMAALSIRLAPGVAKGPDGKDQELTIPAGGVRVRMTFELPGRSRMVNGSVRFRALDAAGRPIIWTSGPVRSETAGSIGEVTVEPDTSVLRPGDYIAEVVDAGGSVLESYVFRVNGL